MSKTETKAFDYERQLKKVTSSNVYSIAYDEERNDLYIKFRSNGAVYRYPNVHRQFYDRLASAPSIGKFVHREVVSAGMPFERLS